MTGIDYGRGQMNIDHANGIRFGVISQHSVVQAWADSAEPDYGSACCPKCGNEALEYNTDRAEEWESGCGCADFMCERCEYVFDSGEAYLEDPRGWSYNAEGYKLIDCLDSDIMVLKSPYYTLAPFCSPCVPGAGNLNSACDDGVKSYCLGHDWFEDAKAPYVVYSVVTGEIVAP